MSEMYQICAEHSHLFSADKRMPCPLCSVASLKREVEEGRADLRHWKTSIGFDTPEQAWQNVNKNREREWNEAYARGWRECREAAGTMTDADADELLGRSKACDERGSKEDADYFDDCAQVLIRQAKKIRAITPPSAGDENQAALSADCEESDEQD